MSKERARRRTERLAVQAKEREKRARVVARRAKRRALVRSLTPRLPDRRTGRLFARRSTGERVLIAIFSVAALAAVWLGIDSLPLRIAFTLLAVLVVPALVVVAFDRRV